MMAMVTAHQRGHTDRVERTTADVADAVRRHPSSRDLSPEAQGRLVWRQLSLFADQGYEHDEPMRMRRPQSAQRVRQLRQLVS